MNTVEENRRLNLIELEKEYGSQVALSRKIDKSAAQISQWKNASKYSKSEKRRVMDRTTARVIEQKTGRPNGWMDSDHSIAANSEAKPHLSPVKYQSDSILIPQYDAAGSMGDGAYNDDVTVIRSLLVSKEWLASNIPHCTSYENLAVVTGMGDSMTGIFSNGDPIIIDTGVKSVDHDGLYYFGVGRHDHIKRLQRIHGDGIVVISENKAYKEWYIKESDEMRVYGKVLRAWEGRNF